MPPTQPQQKAPFLGRAFSDAENQNLAILQLDIEGLKLPKLNVMERLTSTTKANVVCSKRPTGRTPPP